MSIELPTTAEVVVIGGGVMGASSAFHLAHAGMKDVVLLEREPLFGQGATGRCAGGVRYQFATEINVKLSIQSLAMLDDFHAQTGQDCDYRKCGYFFILTDPKDLQNFRINLAMQNRMGVQTEWISPDDIQERLPYMCFDDALGGTFNAHDGLADPNSVVMGYISRGRTLGVQAYTDVEVLDIEIKGGRVQSVQTSSGNISCQAVINAAGPWVAQIGKKVGIDIPITPIRRQMLTTTPLPKLPKDFPFVIDFAQSLYFHREGEGILTGMSNPHQKLGYDQSLDLEWELIAMDAAIERLPMLNQAGKVAAWAGLYEVTPDAHPIFGPTVVDGFWIVGGFSGHGFMHGPIAGKIMAEFLLTGQASSVDVSTLDLARFEEGRLIQEYNVI